jgi:sugar phosphate isomerase/epimerase
MKNAQLAAALFLVTITIVASAQETGRSPKATSLTNPLAVRAMNYGRYQDDAWTHLPSLGVHYVFLNVPKADQVLPLEKGLAQGSLRPLVFHGETDLGRDTSVEELASQLAVCGRMGVKYLFLSPKHTDVTKEVAYERLRLAGDAARKHGVTIVLETHPDLGTNADAHLETMRRINHPNVRVNFDTGNITYYNQGLDAASELTKIIDYVAAVELKDHNGRFMDWNVPVAGKGVVDFPAVLKVLEERRFQGPITIEAEGVKGVEMDETQTKRYIAESVGYIQSLGNFR